MSDFKPFVPQAPGKRGRLRAGGWEACWTVPAAPSFCPGTAWHDLALGTPVTTLFCPFVRTKPLRASTQRPRTRPKVPTALMSLRLSSRKVGGHPSGLEGVDLGLWVFPSLEGRARALRSPLAVLEARVQAGASRVPNRPLQAGGVTHGTSRPGRKAPWPLSSRLPAALALEGSHSAWRAGLRPQGPPSSGLSCSSVSYLTLHPTPRPGLRPTLA